MEVEVITLQWLHDELVAALSLCVPEGYAERSHDLFARGGGY
jgi:hypothetical protein